LPFFTIPRLFYVSSFLFFIPSFPFLEALAQEELTKGFIKGKYTANLQRTQRQQPAAPKFKNMQLIIRQQTNSHV
jgi:hypothetical protein